MPGVVGTPDVEGVILKAEDGYGGEVSNEILMRIYDQKPKIDNTNSSCLDGTTYKYLDDEPLGIYNMNFKNCFVPQINRKYIYLINQN